ncbi:hypothetical protein ADS69_00168 [Enterobacter phage phiEap-3]|uniref:Uncharacterized protein n=1 Tax=Enterobacter phage phiEap-3 TaxID=1682394 RepID=A0A0K2FHP0_9CAUD|nr:hypothetical protein FDI05_gp168 [Enterobacter phage phiEap-3]ALA45273.1 hypothetical protein ADS69_00168 [Enterobacter phage phiEap-3]
MEILYKSRNYKKEDVVAVYIKYRNVKCELSGIWGYDIVVEEVNADNKTICSFTVNSDSSLFTTEQLEKAYDLRNQAFNAVRIK